MAGRVTFFKVRPDGFEYPTGVSTQLVSLSVDYVVVAGGGGGGSTADNVGSGGGGAGGFLQGSGFPIVFNNQITIGAGGTGAPSTAALSTNGSNSLVKTLSNVSNNIQTFGGGRGGSSGGPFTRTYAGMPGGSGGGAYAITPIGALGTPGQGNNGGNRGNYGGGGGGGAGGAGSDGVVNTGGAGGVGTANPISGTPVTYAQGGGGGGQSPVQGTGGGATPGTANAVANRGGGGGGAGSPSYPVFIAGGSGGSGVVIFSYDGPQKATGGTVTTPGANTIHTFTGDGWFNVNAEFLYSIN